MSAMNAYLDALSLITEPDWLADDRRAALERFVAAGLPNAREEAWKYTSLQHLEQAGLHPPAAGATETVCPDVAVSVYPSHVLAFRNGQLTCHGTWLSNQVAGTLRQLGETPPVYEYLGSLAGGNALASLNLALWQDGTRLCVPAGMALEVPIFAVYAADEADAMLHPRTLAVLEEGSEAVLVEHYLGQTGRTYWQNAVSEIVLAEGARLTHVRLVEEGPGATHTGLTAVRLGRDSEYRALHVGLDGALTRHDMTVALEGAGARIRIDGFDLADGRRHADLHLRVEHRAADTASRITWRGMAAARGRAIFDGHVTVQRTAHRTDAKQSCRGLLLSPHAEVDAMPRLEIYADDVKCGHGASIGNLDRDALFYLQSRGIDAAAARQLLLQGFAAEALGLLDELHLRQWFAPRLEAALSRQGGKEAAA
jgi:Fe-S cluster assembly protein SufD